MAPGVLRTRVGFTGGKSKSPTYHDLADHTEAIQIDFDPTQTSFQKLLEIFWSNGGCSTSPAYSRQYMSAVFYADEEQKKLAKQSKKDLAKVKGRKITTGLYPLSKFTNAEYYHQKFYLRGRGGRLLKELDLSNAELINSTIAARLNGLCGGGRMDLTKEVASEIRKYKWSDSALPEVEELLAGTKSRGKMCG